MADNNPITERGVLGIFFDALETALGLSWAGMIGLEIDADAEVINHRWLGQAPQMREWIGGAISKQIRNRSLQVVNKLYEATTHVDTDDLRRDKTGQLQIKAADDLAGTAVEHWEEVVTSDVIVGNPTGYDGVAFFATTHPIEETGGTQSNLLTLADVPALDVTTANNPTREEAIQIIIGMAQKFYGLRTDRNRPANGRAREFVMMVPENMLGAFTNAANDMLANSGSTNQTLNQIFRVTVLPNPFLLIEGGLDTEIYMFRTDAPGSRPIILQRETEPSLEVIDDKRERVLNRRITYHVSAWRKAAPGEYRHALKATLS